MDYTSVRPTLIPAFPHDPFFHPILNISYIKPRRKWPLISLELAANFRETLFSWKAPSLVYHLRKSLLAVPETRCGTVKPGEMLASHPAVKKPVLKIDLSCTRLGRSRKVLKKQSTGMGVMFFPGWLFLRIESSVCEAIKNSRLPLCLTAFQGTVLWSSSWSLCLRVISLGALIFDELRRQSLLDSSRLEPPPRRGISLGLGICGFQPTQWCPSDPTEGLCLASFRLRGGELFTAVWLLSATNIL